MSVHEFRKIDSLFDFELQLDKMIELEDPDIKQTAIDKIKEVCIESFLLGLGARQMSVNKNGGGRNDTRRIY